MFYIVFNYFCFIFGLTIGFTMIYLDDIKSYFKKIKKNKRSKKFNGYELRNRIINGETYYAIYSINEETYLYDNTYQSSDFRKYWGTDLDFVVEILSKKREEYKNKIISQKIKTMDI